MPRETGAGSRWCSETALSACLGAKRPHPSSHVLVGDTASFLFPIRHCDRTFMQPGLFAKTVDENVGKFTAAFVHEGGNDQ